MKVIEVIKDACIYLTKEEELNYLVKKENNSEVDFDEEKLKEIINNTDLLVKCFNFVLNTLCSEYLKLKDKVVVHTNTGKIAYSEISDFNILNIISIEDDMGNSVPFADYGGEVVLSAIGRYKITYTYCFDDMDIDTSINEITIPAKTLAYGVASEYLYINKLYDDAAIWDTRFKNSLSNLLSNKKQLYIKPRRWF